MCNSFRDIDQYIRLSHTNSYTTYFKQDIESYLSAENRKDQEVIAVRLENIKLKNKLKKKEQQLKSKVSSQNCVQARTLQNGSNSWVSMPIDDMHGCVASQMNIDLYGRMQ